MGLVTRIACTDKPAGRGAPDEAAVAAARAGSGTSERIARARKTLAGNRMKPPERERARRVAGRQGSRPKLVRKGCDRLSRRGLGPAKKTSTGLGRATSSWLARSG